MFPESFIKEVKNAVNIVDLISEYTELSKAGSNLYSGLCPHPDHNDKDPSLRVWEKTQSWSCMVCHSGKKDKHNLGSDCFSFIQWIKNMSWKESVLYLANKYDINLPDDENSSLYEDKKNLALSYYYNLKDKSYDYLISRGLTDDSIREYCLGFDGLKITFPLMDKYKKVLGFTRRWIDIPEGCKDKYRNSYNSKIFNKKMYLYGLHNLDRNFEEIRITEGPMDVILSTQFKAKNVFATLGTAFTEEHVNLIKLIGKTPVFCFDGDPAGLASIEKSIEELSNHGIYSKVLILPEGKDLANIALEEKENIENYISSNSKTYGNYLIEKELSRYLSGINELKLKYYPSIMDIIEKVPSEAERKILKGYIEKIMNIKL